MVALAVARTGVFFVTGLPESVEDWFALFGRSRLLGPLAFNALTARRLLILAWPSDQRPLGHARPPFARCVSMSLTGGNLPVHHDSLGLLARGDAQAARSCK
jgi:hypothetical protein